MVMTSQKQRELFDMLVQYAGGDIELVKRAIWAASEKGGPASLTKIREYIDQHKQPEKIRA